MNNAKLSLSKIKLDLDKAQSALTKAQNNLNTATSANRKIRQTAVNTAKAAFDKVKASYDTQKKIADARTAEWETVNKQIEDMKRAPINTSTGSSAFPSVGVPPNIATTNVGTIRTQVKNYGNSIAKLMPEEEGFQSSVNDVNDYVRKRAVYSTLQDTFDEAKTVAKNAQDLDVIEKDRAAWKNAFNPLYQQICVNKLPSGNTLYEEHLDSLSMRTSADCAPL
jgi:hypothetical protein